MESRLRTIKSHRENFESKSFPCFMELEILLPSLQKPKNSFRKQEAILENIMISTLLDIVYVLLPVSFVDGEISLFKVHR
jgi:hypothetical protein